MKQKILLGIDGGGTYIRVAVTDQQGKLLAYVNKKGSSAPSKDANAKENLYDAVCEAVNKAGVELDNITHMTAGLAGLDSDSDMEWVKDLTGAIGLKCSITHVNDAVPAHFGAFLSLDNISNNSTEFTPGIMAISGTGSIVFGINETGRHIRNYDYHHYAYSAARFLAYEAVYKTIAGETDESDEKLVSAILEYFTAKDLPALSELGAAGFDPDYRIRDERFGRLAPAVTAAALNGSALAQEICNNAAGQILTGIKLVGSRFESSTVKLALMGSVLNSQYINDKIAGDINSGANKEYILCKPTLPAAFGAAAISMQSSGIALSQQILNNLKYGAEFI